MASAQSYAQHTKLDVLHHFVIGPILLVNFGLSFGLWRAHHEAFPVATVWWIVLSFGLTLLSVKVRVYALRNQDRLIRLEERLRLTGLMGGAEPGLVAAVTMRQWVALRFASDGEVVGLARRAVAEGLGAKQIKAAITSWRPDDERV